MEKLNCWEVMNCDKGPDSPDLENICPAAKSGRYDSINHGKFAGRFCWAVKSTQCRGQIQDNFAGKLMDCLYCKFFQQVNRDEGRNFIMVPKP